MYTLNGDCQTQISGFNNVIVTLSVKSCYGNIVFNHKNLPSIYKFTLC